MFAFPVGTPGLAVTGQFQGLGLRGNASPHEVRCAQRLHLPVGEPGGGFDIMLQAVTALVQPRQRRGLRRASQAALERPCGNQRRPSSNTSTRACPRSPPSGRSSPRCRSTWRRTRAYLEATAGPLAEPADDTMLHVLGVKAAANDAALRITDTAMRVCGGAAFSEHLRIDRYFRDARAGSVMAPTADVLYDFYGKAITGMSCSEHGRQ